jgi:hypothetical protein
MTDVTEGDYSVIALCDNPAKHSYFHPVDADIDLVPIKGHVSPSPPAKPTAVKAKPLFTG